MMQASGIMFLSQTAPQFVVATDGTAELTLLAFDRLGAHQVEPWRIKWTGENAQEFYNLYGPILKPGQPLHVEAKRMRLFTNGRNGGPEVHAIASVIELAPLARQPSNPAVCITSY